MSRVGLGTQGAGGRDQGERLLMLYEETLSLENHIQTYSDFQDSHFPETFLMLNILGTSCTPWLLL